MRGATGITLQPHQMLRLPRKMTRIIDPRDIWNVIYNARSNSHHPPTSPNTAPATQNCIPKSKRNCPKIVEVSFTMGDRFDHDPSMNSSSRTRPFAEVTFHALETHFVLKNIENYNISRSGYHPDFTKYCACHEKWHSDITKYCPCHEKWHSDITKYCACHEKWHSKITKCCACHEKWHSKITKYFACLEKWHWSGTYWAVTLLSCYFTELLLYGTVTLLSCYSTELLLSNLSGYFTELLLYWTVTSLSCYFTELKLYWAVTLLSCYFTELLLY